MFKRNHNNPYVEKQRYGFTNIHVSCKHHSTFLFPNPSPWVSAGSIFNLAGNYYDFNYSKSHQEADYRAAVNDWCAVYHDLNNSFQKIKGELETV